jgi:hypothetical protein
MALTFTKGANKAAAPKSEGAAPKEGSSSGGMSWLKTGKAAHEAFHHETAKAEMAKAEAGKLFRFFVPENEERQITFLDGELDSDGMLDIPMYYEHVLKVNGTMQNFVCLALNGGAEAEPCPVCERNDKDGKARLVGVLTIIDHTPYKIKGGQNAGKIIQNTRKLVIATRTSVQALTKIAVKRGGLTGCTFDVSRNGDTSPGIGNQFDFVVKYDSLEALAHKYDMKLEEVQPADYATEITRHSAEEMIALGAGKAITGPGYSTASSSSLKDNL